MELTVVYASMRFLYNCQPGFSGFFKNVFRYTAEWLIDVSPPFSIRKEKLPCFNLKAPEGIINTSPQVNKLLLRCYTLKNSSYFGIHDCKRQK